MRLWLSIDIRNQPFTTMLLLEFSITIYSLFAFFMIYF